MNDDIPLDQQTLVVRSALNKQHRYVVVENGTRVEIPLDWENLPPGDAAITKTLKKIGPTWTAQRKKGRKIFSDGVWALITNISQAKQLVADKRGTDQYARKRVVDLKRRELKHNEYVSEFYEAVVDYLSFDCCYEQISNKLAKLITDHATPVGSGTVARTEMIPIQQRASAALTAWMRHKVTNYDNMAIKRVRGERREVRKSLAVETRSILAAYQKGDSIVLENCPLYIAINSSDSN